jgi:hypothetical protein
VPGDLKECRMHAANCRTLAAQATPSAKETFTHLAETWERLAAELESAQTFLKAMAAARVHQGTVVYCAGSASGPCASPDPGSGAHRPTRQRRSGPSNACRSFGVAMEPFWVP